MQWLILNFAGPGSWIGPTVLKQLLSGPTTDLNIIFPITWVSAVFSFFVILLLLFKRTSVLNSFMIASVCPFGAAFLFEFIFSIVAMMVHGHPILHGNPYYMVLGVSWLIMPISGIGFWSRNRILSGSIVVFIVGFIIWIIIGFPILSGFSSLLLNYITKIASFSIITSLFIERACLKKK
ncbi:hypothetical protein KAI23_04290 [Candidatus Bathyarchaeota archaeon]|nr:hypothetical protein [Candidatus Bathyarchaeota archaeon]